MAAADPPLFDIVTPTIYLLAIARQTFAGFTRRPHLRAFMQKVKAIKASGCAHMHSALALPVPFRWQVKLPFSLGDAEASFQPALLQYRWPSVSLFLFIYFHSLSGLCCLNFEVWSKSQRHLFLKNVFVYCFFAFSVFMFTLLQKRAINMLYKRTDGYNPACLHPITLFLNMHCPFPQSILPLPGIQSTSWHLQKCKMLDTQAT